MTDQITDHAQRAKDLLPGQFHDKDNFTNLIDALTAGKQEIEDELYRFFDELSLENATGTQLDGIGEILGETRQGRTDTQYRAALNVRVKINISRGEPETLIAVLAAITDSTYISLTEPSTARVNMWFNGATIPDSLYENMDKIKSAGVALQLTGNGGGTPFVFSGDTDGLGFSDIGFLTGGELSEVWA